MSHVARVVAVILEAFRNIGPRSAAIRLSASVLVARADPLRSLERRPAKRHVNPSRAGWLYSESQELREVSAVPSILLRLPYALHYEGRGMCGALHGERI